jgi:hypothetical protein
MRTFYNPEPNHRSQRTPRFHQADGRKRFRSLIPGFSVFFALALRWHVTCKHSCGFKSMATKVRLLKMFQEMRGLAQITQRHPTPRLPGLFLLQLRSHLAHTTATRAKRVIPVEVQERPDISHPVKINHVPVKIFPLPELRA